MIHLYEEYLINLNKLRNKEQAAIKEAEMLDDKNLITFEKLIKQQNYSIKQLNQIITDQNNTIHALLNSRSWYIKRPIRLFSYVINKSPLGIFFKLLKKSIRYLIFIIKKFKSSIKNYLYKIMKKIRYPLKANPNYLHALLMLGENYKTFLPNDCNLYENNFSESVNFSPKVSIIVPNFNHSSFLKARLESIFNQTYTNYEVILLDDCSTDNSQEILNDYALRFNANCYFNKENSGKVFYQWCKGIELATGELIWIAESDDLCALDFLEKMIGYFKNQAIMLAFCRTEFVKGTPLKTIWSSEEYLSDLNMGKTSFIQSAQYLVNNGWGIKNIIPNVSSVVFRNPGKTPLFQDSSWLNLRLCGDWIFYLTMIRGGLVAYTTSTTNYYRQHNSNTSSEIQKMDSYYQEHERVAQTLLSNFKIHKEVLEQQEAQLYQHWVSFKYNDSKALFFNHYNIERIKEKSPLRKPNILMVVYALVSGGGETFPIILANMLKERGYGVTCFNFNCEPTQPEIRSMLSANIPLLELHRRELIGIIAKNFEIDLVHSHHAWADINLSSMLINYHEIKQIVTMHGMYELFLPEQLASIIPLLDQKVEQFIYTAEKNTQPFLLSFQEKKHFIRINNALPNLPITTISRESLKIQNDSFVICLVSRAIPEKGWEETITAVMDARKTCQKNIELLLIGEGIEYERLRLDFTSDYIHFLGFKKNVRDYFSLSDLGILPSRFKGESFPLVLIDCLLAGRPMLASNIGEISQMLSTEKGYAGVLFDLENWEISVDKLSALIAKIATDAKYYQILLKEVPLAAKKFNIDEMVQQYDNVYSQILAPDLIE